MAYPSTWTQNGVIGSPLLVGEEGQDYTDGRQTYKLSKKVSSINLVLKSVDNGVNWTLLALTSGYTINTTTNEITFVTTLGIADLFQVFYQSHTSMAEPTVNSAVRNRVIGDVLTSSSGASNWGSFLTSSLSGKVQTNASHPFMVSNKLSQFTIESTNKLSPTGTFPVINNQITIGGTTTAVKVFPYLTTENGRKVVNLVFKEMKFDTSTDTANEQILITSANQTTDGVVGSEYYVDQSVSGILSGKILRCKIAFTIDWNSTAWVDLGNGNYGIPSSSSVYLEQVISMGWGDDNKFNIIGNVSTTVDDNGNTVLIGQKKIVTPYFAKEK